MWVLPDRFGLKKLRFGSDRFEETSDRFGSVRIGSDRFEEISDRIDSVRFGSVRLGEIGLVQLNLSMLLGSLLADLSARSYKQTTFYTYLIWQDRFCITTLISGIPRIIGLQHIAFFLLTYTQNQ